MRRWICAALLAAAVCVPESCVAAPSSFDFRLTRTQAYWVSEIWLGQELVWQVALATGEAVAASTGAPEYRAVILPEFSHGLFSLKIR